MAPDPLKLRRDLERAGDADLAALAPTMPEAFEVIFSRHHASILAFVVHLAGNRDVAAEIAAETFAVALESIDRFDPARGELRGWLFGIARITTLASFRARRTEDDARRRLGATVIGHSDAAWKEAEARLDAALPGLVDSVAELPPAERAAVFAKIVEERDYAEIAASERASEAAIRQRVKRGLDRLRGRIGDGES